jgi:alcohol dehydrogenase (cytochrome c)
MNIFGAARRRPLLAVGVVILAGVAAVFALPQLRWRAQVTLMHLSGQIPDIEIGEVLAYMSPGSDQSLARLIETRNPYAVIRNAKTSEDDVEAGSGTYREHCAACHGPDATGGPTGPALIGRPLKHGESDWAVYRTIRDGVPNTAMVPTLLTEDQRWQVIAFLYSIDIPDEAGAAVNVDAALAADIDVPYEEIAALDEPGKDWLTYSGSYQGTRHSSLSQINQANVDQLAAKWIHQFKAPYIETSPLVRDGVMFVSVPPCSVSALNAVTGHVIWEWACNLLVDSPNEIANRGVALLDDKVFIATWDARLFALDAATGAELWQTAVSDDPVVYYISGAPLAYRDLVVTGISTRQVGQGVLAAFDANTGEERWRFVVIPGPGEPGHETWAGESWRVGGGPTWLTGTYDADEDLLYWGVGNPKPDYDTSGREGDNLYTNSVVAVRGSTGKLVWHFQFTPADDKDWGSNQIPVLVDRTANGSVEKQMLWANRNGFYYVFDRVSGKYLLGTPFVQQNWTSGLDSNGRPMPPPESERSEGQLLFPGNNGGTHWWSPSYYPPRDILIVPVLEQGMVFFPSANSPPRSGRAFYTALRALDSSTGKLVWEYRRPPRVTDNFMPGVLSTAGGIVFGSDQQMFFALNADNGEFLWSMETGGRVIAVPVTFEVDGQQFVSIAAGSDLLTFSLPPQRRPAE